MKNYGGAPDLSTPIDKVVSFHDLPSTSLPILIPANSGKHSITDLFTLSTKHMVREFSTFAPKKFRRADNLSSSYFAPVAVAAGKCAVVPTI